MTAHQEAMLLNARAEIEAMVARREGMVAANQHRLSQGLSIAYDDEAFENVAIAIRAAAPNMNADWS